MLYLTIHVFKEILVEFHDWKRRRYGLKSGNQDMKMSQKSIKFHKRLEVRKNENILTYLNKELKFPKITDHSTTNLLKQLRKNHNDKCLMVLKFILIVNENFKHSSIFESWNS